MSSFWNSPAWTMAPRVKSTNKKAPPAVPGPGNYSSTNIGKHNPAWKIGEAPRDSAKTNQGPGPGQYNLNGSKSGPKITISGKGKTSSLADTLQPGPGNYNPSTDGVYKNTAAFTMGAKYGSREEDPQPGPGAYNASKELKNNGPKMGTSKRGGLQGKYDGPGPGQYAQSRPFSAGPKYGFGNQIKSNGGYDQRPGPGQYEIIAEQQFHLKGCTIGEKFNKKSNINNGPGPGSYDTGMKRPQSGAKIGKASRISYNDGIGPGPGAYQQFYKHKGGSEIKIGTSTRGGFGKQQTPGPGAYELLKNNGKGVSISGYKGKQAIDLTPGPGAYELVGDDLKRPCSAKIGKGQRSHLNLNETPGPGQYYPQDPSNYKFAYTKEPRSKDLRGGDPGPGQYEIPPTVPSAPHYLIDPSVYRSYG